MPLVISSLYCPKCEFCFYKFTTHNSCIYFDTTFWKCPKCGTWKDISHGSYGGEVSEDKVDKNNTDWYYK